MKNIITYTLLLLSLSASSQKAVMAYKEGSVYSTTDTTSKKLASFKEGEKLTILFEFHTWAEVQYKDIKGYTLKSMLSSASIPVQQSTPAKIQTAVPDQSVPAKSNPCPTTSRCGCSKYTKSSCGGACCTWTVGYGCGCR